jgi:RimJ/RimL family protein N-acetyltransferase
MFGASLEHAQSPLTEEEVKQMFEKMRKSEYEWVIEHEEHFLGEIGLRDLNKQDRKARLATGLFDPNKLGRGFGREAISLVLAYAFQELRLNR